jgi:hypothetical protein
MRKSLEMQVRESRCALITGTTEITLEKTCIWRIFVNRETVGDKR